MLHNVTFLVGVPALKYYKIFILDLFPDMLKCQVKCRYCNVGKVDYLVLFSLNKSRDIIISQLTGGYLLTLVNLKGLSHDSEMGFKSGYLITQHFLRKMIECPQRPQRYVILRSRSYFGRLRLKTLKSLRLRLRLSNQICTLLASTT